MSNKRPMWQVTDFSWNFWNFALSKSVNFILFLKTGRNIVLLFQEVVETCCTQFLKSVVAIQALSPVY